MAINQINSQSESIFKSIDSLTNKINSLEPTILEIKSYLDWFKHPFAKCVFGTALAILMYIGHLVWDFSIIKPIARLEKSIARLEESDKDINKILNSINDQLSFLKGSFELVSKNKATTAEAN
jgi:prefoldin subunit 5